MAVKKVDSPLLIIGLGGTGSAAAARVKQAFAQRLELAPSKDVPPRTRFLIIDTDEREKAKYNWQKDEFFSIANNFAAIKGDMTPWEKKWFDMGFKDPEGLLTGSSGAGVYRQISRLFLFRKIDELCSTLASTINDVRKVSAGEDPGRKLEIRVLAGISGGTGSGTVLDIAYILRYVLRDVVKLRSYDYSLEAMVIMPDVTIAQHATADAIRRELYEANGYAALKEIDFWMYYEAHHHQYTQQYSHSVTITWDHAPYDDLVLLNATNLEGAAIDRAHEHINDAIAEYLVNCFSGDYDQQEDIVQFNGQPTQAAAGAAPKEMTFESQRNNDLAQLNAIRKEYFVPYRYRSIGAFSNTGDETNILNRQWNLILDETVTRIEANKPHMDGVAPEEFRTLCVERGVGSTEASSLRMAYGESHGIPDVFGNMDAKTLRTLSYEAAPHGSQFEMFKKNIDQSRGDDVADLVKKGRQILHDAFQGIICDLEKGPEYCYQLLSHAQKGLLAAMEEEKSKAANLQREAEAYIREYSGPDGLSERAMQELKDLGLVERALREKTYFENYKDTVASLYAAAHAVGYYRALAGAMPELISYAKLYEALLSDMLTGLRNRREDYRQMVRDAASKGSAAVHLLDGGKVETSLLAAFEADEQKNALAKRAFQTVADTVDEALEAHRQSLPEKEVALMLQRGIEQVREKCFSEIDAMSIESKLQAFGGLEGRGLKEYTTEVIMPKLVRGATPMFHAAYPLSKQLKNLVESYMGTVPRSAQSIQEGITEYMSSDSMGYANLKMSNIPDRLFWVTSIMGMPMMAYAGLQGYYKTYVRKLNDHKAIHLCMNAGATLDDPQEQNWDLLPEPACERRTQLSDEEKLVEALLRAGVLNVEVTFVNKGGQYIPQCQLSWNRLKPFGEADYVTTESMGKAIDSALEGKNTMADRVAALNQLRKRFDVVPIQLDKLEEKAEAWASVIDLGGKVTTEISVNKTDAEREELKDAWVKSYQRAAFEYVTRTPQLMGYMRTNLECYKMIDDRIARESTPDKGEVLANAETFGRMYRYDLITVTRAGGEFVSEEISDSNRAIYTGDDSAVEDFMKKFYAGFGEYSLRLQNILYYASMVGGKDRRDNLQRDELEKLEKAYQTMLRSLPEDDEPDMREVERQVPGMGGFIDKAKRLSELLDKDVRAVRTLYTDGTIGEKERDEVCEILEKIAAETKRFLRAWR